MKSDRNLISRVWQSMDYMERFDWIVSELEKPISMGQVKVFDYNEIVFSNGIHLTLNSISAMDVNEAFSHIDSYDN